VLWFDEYYHSHNDYRFDEAQEAAATMSLILFVGTSFSVGITEIFLRAAAARSIPAFAIDPAGDRGRPYPWVRFLSAQAEALLPEVCGLLGMTDPGAEDPA
jgi:NAD-dependent deacetylase